MESASQRIDEPTNGADVIENEAKNIANRALNTAERRIRSDNG
jgi:hypothetical protein